MPKRTIYIQNEAFLSVKHRSLIIQQEELNVAIPLEDIWVLILESLQTVMSVSVLSSLADAGVGVIVCGSNHMPNGMSLPIGAHSRHASIVENQLAMPKPLCKQLWKRIIVSKINNQARVIDLAERQGSERLYELSRQVRSGDSDNREAIAASIYFSRLLPDGTRRNSSSGSCLDYGYAILRAGIARCAVAGGWLVSRGIHHSSDLNAFNLVDDLIEPFRPLVDLVVMKKLDGYVLSPRNKAELARLFEYHVAINDKQYTVQSAIEHMLDSLKQAVLLNDADCLALPQVIDLMIRDEVDR